MARAKIRWADTLDEEEYGEVLPPTTVKGPDSHGVKIVTEYFRNDKGDAIKKVTKSKVVQVEKKVYKVRAAGARACARDMRRSPRRRRICRSVDASPLAASAACASSRQAVAAAVQAALLRRAAAGSSCVMHFAPAQSAAPAAGASACRVCHA